MKTALNPAPAPTVISGTVSPAAPAHVPESTAVSFSHLPEPAVPLHALPAPRMHAVKSKGWACPGSSSKPAYISLSRDHVALLKAPDGRLLTPIDLGRMELSTRQAWDAAADALLRTQSDRIEFTVRNASFALGDDAPRGLEVHGGEHPPAAWLAHPRTFQVLHSHFTEVLSPAAPLLFATRDHKELFVFDAEPAEIKACAPAATVFTYSFGFPVCHRNRRASERAPVSH